MKNAYIIHGWSGSPRENMLQWLKAQLEASNFNVTVPAMPDRHHPKINEWVAALNNLVEPTADTVMIGHSIGCQGVLRYLEQADLKTPIAQSVLIAPWMQLDQNTIEEEGPESVAIAQPWVETPIDFERVKRASKKFTAIFSDNDPFVPLDQKDLFQKKLNAEIIVKHNQGHFTVEDGVKEIPDAIDAIG